MSLLFTLNHDVKIFSKRRGGGECSGRIPLRLFPRGSEWDRDSGPKNGCPLVFEVLSELQYIQVHLGLGFFLIISFSLVTVKVVLHVRVSENTNPPLITRTKSKKQRPKHSKNSLPLPFGKRDLFISLRQVYPTEYGH